MEKSFDELEHNLMSDVNIASENDRYDVGIVGWWYNENYGGTLTYYALHQVLKSMGLSVLMIERPTADPKYVPNYASIPRRFAKKHYSITKNYHPNQMGVLNKLCTAFISGSDQLFSPWLWEYSGPSYYLDFVQPDKNIISYASSFGNSYASTDEFRAKISYYLHRFNRISVREDYAVDIVKNNFGLNAQKVLDPIFVCDPMELHQLADQSKVKKEKKYFASFFLDPCKEKREAILYLKEKLGLPYVNLIHACDFEINSKKLGLDEIKPDLDIEDFLNYYRNAEFIITDSFHGTCLAIIFKKPFISIANKERGANRFVSMLKEAGLLNRLVNDYSEIYSKAELFYDINYDEVGKRLEPLRENSYNWLKQAIFEPHNKAAELFNIIDIKQYEKSMKILSIQDTIYKQQREISNLQNDKVRLSDQAQRFEQQVQHAQGKIEALERQKAQLEVYLSDAIKDFTDKIEKINRDIKQKGLEYEKEKSILSLDIKKAKEESERVALSNANLRKQIDDYEHSNSWKITKPLRFVSKFFRKLFGKK